MGSSSSVAAAERLVATPHGAARLVTYRATRRRGRVHLVLGHGAGRGIDSPDLQALAHALPAYGCRVTLVEQPWRVAGGRVASAPARLDECWVAALAADGVAGDVARDVAGDGVGASETLVVGGRSAGARVACRTATAVGAAAVVALAFPLHPPGRADDPTRSRLPELTGAAVPVLVVQGARDTFGSAATLRAALARTRASAAIQVVEAPYADHGLAVPKSAPLTRSELLDRVTSAVGGWLRTLR